MPTHLLIMPPNFTYTFFKDFAFLTLILLFWRHIFSFPISFKNVIIKMWNMYIPVRDVSCINISTYACCFRSIVLLFSFLYNYILLLDVDCWRKEFHPSDGQCGNRSQDPHGRFRRIFWVHMIHISNYEYSCRVIL